MQIAYLILAHNNYIHLQRLIDALNTEDCRFYIHIDRKSPLPAIKGDNIFYVDKRVTVYYKCYSEVEATLKLMKRAACDENDYVIFISGADYPVRSNEAIRRKLAEGGEFIDIEKGFSTSKPKSRFEYYYFNFIDRRARANKEKMPMTILFLAVEKMMRLIGIKKRIRFDIFSGTQWFAVSKDCLEYILGNHAKYVPFFKTCRVQSESFFHTVIGNSHHMQNVRPWFGYHDFRTEPSPALIGRGHIELLGKNDFLFARKFTDESAGVTELIDMDLRRDVQ